MGQRVLVIGATRGTGFLIAGLLLRDGYRVLAVARSETKARTRLDPAVEVLQGDITQPATLAGAFGDVDHAIFTAGVTQRPSGEGLVRATEFEGVRNVLAAAKSAGFAGRFLYMTSIGVTRRSLAAAVLNLVKGNTLKWRLLAESEIRKSGLDYTIVRAGLLTNDPGGRKPVEVAQNDYPLTVRYRISRADVAEVFVRALQDPRTRRTTFDVVSGKEAEPSRWETLFAGLKPDIWRPATGQVSTLPPSGTL